MSGGCVCPPSRWPRETRLLCMIGLTAALFVLELVVGHVTNCVALIADSFHVLSDALALAVALAAARASRLTPPQGSRFTYGFARAELLGGLVNLVFLSALMLSITTEALHRFFEPQAIRRPELLISVASFGLVVNLVGLCIFREHGHAGGACHGHSHAHAEHDEGGCEQAHAHTHAARYQPLAAKEMVPAPADAEAGGHERHGHHHGHGHGHGHGHAHARGCDHAHGHGARHHQDDGGGGADTPTTPLEAVCTFLEPRGDDRPEPGLGKGALGSPDVPPPPLGSKSEVVSKASLSEADSDAVLCPYATSGTSPLSAASPPRAMLPGVEGGASLRAVFLHVLGDALGSAAVIAGGTVMWLATGWHGRWVIDPCLSLLIVGIVTYSSVPLLRELVAVFLQAAPPAVDVSAVAADVAAAAKGGSVTELRVWQLSDVRAVATVRIRGAPGGVRGAVADAVTRHGIGDVIVEVR